MGLVSRIDTDLLSPQNQDGVRDKMQIAFVVKQQVTAKLVIFSGETCVFVQEYQANPGENVILEWDGTDNQTAHSGHLVADGLYRYEVLFTDETQPIDQGEVRIKNTPPKQITLAYPAFGVSLTAPPQLAWSAQDDVVYEISYTQDPLWGIATKKTTAEAFYQLPQLERGTWYWRVIAQDAAGNRSPAAEGYFTLEQLDTSSFKLINFAMGPNPLLRESQLSVSFTLQQSARVELSIFNLAGRRVYHRLEKSLAAGDQLLKWDGCDEQGRTLPKGAYMLRLVATNQNEEGAAVRQQPVLLLR